MRPIAYVTSRFPHLSETFTANEIIALRQQGCPVHVFSLRSMLPSASVQPISAQLRTTTTYAPFVLSRSLWAAHHRFIQVVPQRYRQTLLDLIRHNTPNPFALAKALLIFPKSVLFAQQVLERGAGHIHANFAALAGTGAWIIARLTQLPFSFTVHAHDIFSRPPWLSNPMLCRKFREAAFVVAISEYNRQYLINCCGSQDANKIHVIHVGIDTNLFQPGQKKLHNGTTRILSVGRMVPYKGQRYLIEACRYLTDSGYRIRCDIIGEGPLAKTLAAQIQKFNLGGLVTLHGPLGQDALVNWYDKADIFVLPSVVAKDGQRDGIPVVLMEALAMQKPVVTTPVSGIPELIAHEVNGLLVTPGDARALAQAIERLISNPQFGEQLGANGRKVVEQHFDYCNNAELLFGLFQQSIAN